MSEKTGALAQAGILTRDQLLSELDIQNDTLTRWETDDDFPGRRVGKTGLYDVEAIRRWINKK